MFIINKTSNRSKKVVVGMSGGVDSSVAAAILKRRGYDVIGVTFKTWPKEECGLSVGRACCNLESIVKARMVAEQLCIPYYVIDLHQEFKRDVIDYFCSEYLKGHTPNPCIVCNEKVKFGALLEKARSLGASFVATGHFARVEYDRRRARYLLKAGKDESKDQSYFLYRLSQDQLKHSIMPLGGMTKTVVRRLAKKWKLHTFNSISSQDICFVQDKHYAEYIRKKSGISIEPGEIVDDAGKVIGSHKGITFYTIGQRRGLGIQRKEPLYVTAIDPKHNRIVVGAKKDILKKSLIASGLNWIAPPSSLPGANNLNVPLPGANNLCVPLSGANNLCVSLRGGWSPHRSRRSNLSTPIRCSAKIRYNHKKAPCAVTLLTGGNTQVDFNTPQEAPTPGQAVVFYDRDAVIGGGWIQSVP